MKKKKSVVAGVDASGGRVFVGLCCYGGVHPNFMVSLMQFMNSRGASHLHIIRGDSLVSRARNRIVAEFMKSDCDTLLQIDTDIGFDPDKMIKMLQRGLPVVGGLYALKQKNETAWCMNSLAGKRDRRDGTTEVLYIGTGLFAVKREVFACMIEDGCAQEYEADDNEKKMKLWDFFRVGVVDDDQVKRRRYLSEDWYFCNMARKLGYKIFADRANVGTHYGEISYPLNKA
jgi:hypothetical protein